MENTLIKGYLWWEAYKWGLWIVENRGNQEYRQKFIVLFYAERPVRIFTFTADKWYKGEISDRKRVNLFRYTPFENAMCSYSPYGEREYMGEPIVRL